MATKLDYTLCQNTGCTNITITDTSSFDPDEISYINTIVNASITIAGITDSSVIVTEDIMPILDTLGTGEVIVTDGSINLVGVGTLFTSELVGMDIVINGHVYDVATVIDDTNATLDSAPTEDYTGIFYYFDGKSEERILIYELDSVTDGLYEITYEMTDYNGDTIFVTKTILLYCNVDCCVSKLLLEIPELYKCKSCKKERIQYILEMEGLRRSLENAVGMGKYDIAENILDLLTTICSTQNCNCND